MSDFITDLEGAWKSHQFVVLDTETTGLRFPAEIIQISIRDFMGDEIFESYIKPVHPIPLDATRIHGITNEQVANAPTWLQVRPQIWDLLTDKTVIVYNAEYDYSMLLSSDKVNNLGRAWEQHDSDWCCAMLWYAPIAGDWNDYHGNYRWQKLASACHQQGLKIVDAHNASGDTLMTYKLIAKIMSDRAVGEIEMHGAETVVPCLHPVRDDQPNGDIVCRDCGKTWTI